MEVVCERIPKRFGLDPVRDIQVLTPMNRGGLGARALNVELQKRLNQNTGEKISKWVQHMGSVIKSSKPSITMIRTYLMAISVPFRA